MTLEELVTYLNRQMDTPFLDGDIRETLDKARAATHADPVVGEMITAWMERIGRDDAAAEMERADAVNALGKTRLKYMADDAPVEAFRLVEKTITTLDNAYNEEALSRKPG